MWRFNPKKKLVEMPDGYWVDAESWLEDPQDWIQHLRDKAWWSRSIEANFLEEMEKCVAQYERRKGKARP